MKIVSNDKNVILVRNLKVVFGLTELMGMKKASSYNFLREQNIKVLISCRIIWGLTELLFIPYYSLFALAQDGVTPALLGLIISVRALGLEVLSPIAGHLADSLGRKKMIFAGTFLHSCIYLYYCFARDFKAIFMGSLLEGLSSIHMPALQAITQDSLAHSGRGLGLSTTTALSALPTLVSPLIGGIMAKEFGIDLGMRIGFALGGGVGILIAFIRLKFLRETIVRNGKKTQWKNLFQTSYSNILSLLKEYKALKALLIIAVLGAFFGTLAMPFWVVYATEVVRLSTPEWGLVESIASGIYILVLLFSGKFIDRYGSKKIITVNLLLAPMINLSFLFCTNFPQMLLFRVVLAIQNAFIAPASTALLADIVPRESRGRAIAAIGSRPITMSVRGRASGFFRFPPYFVGSIISGYIFGLDIRYPWFLLAGSYVIGFIICIFLLKEPEKPAD